MNKNLKNIIISFIMTSILFVGAAASWLKPETEFSESERRTLLTKPPFSIATVFSGEFMENFEGYTTDQFPLREKFRRIKAYFSTKVLGKADNNGLYMAEGHISKLEYPENPKMTEYATQKFNFLYDTYIKDTDANVYLSLIPDKNYFLAKKNGYLSIDYNKFINNFKASLPYMKYIDISPLLTINDYYRTDSHWKQESITDVAEFLASSMGAVLTSDYKTNTIEKPFYGVYAGQSALKVEPDTIKYLTNDILDNCKVTYFDSGSPKPGDMYNMEKADGKDPYEMFLSGTSALITIENPLADTEKELVIFRDSFAGSLVPLLSSGYKKITVVDIRYIQSGFVGNYVKFDNQDVLFLYSTTLINNSTAMR